MGAREVIYALAVVAALALIGWMRARLTVAKLRRAEAETARLRSETEQHLKEKEERLERERRLVERTTQARKTEHTWNRELRGEISKLRNERGVLGRTNDIRELVLVISMKLVEARKGLLLARADADGDGKLDLVAARGFSGDPAASNLAQHFAGRVIERDKMVRSDDPVGNAARESAADGEIESVVAIPIYIADDFHGVVVCANRPGGFEELDDQVLLALGDQAGAVLENGRLHGELRDAYVQTVQLLADAVEAKDPFLRIHSDEVCSYVEAVLEQLDVDRRRREEMVFASLLHDIGKIGISERILLKPGRLTDEERSVIELHPQIGYRLIEKVPALRPMSPGILHHHERWDGHGYPSGLKGEEIPLEARVICVADCFSAMTSDRPYRKGMSVEEACAELERNAGTQFDPKVVRLFVDAVRSRRPEQTPSRTLAEAFDDPEIATRRRDGEPLLGAGPAGLVDGLTLLYTRRKLHELADAEAERAGLQGVPFAVIHVAIDGVGELNRGSGWGAGDASIREAAATFEQAAQECGATACRYDGCSFAMVLSRAGREEAEPIASRLTQQLAGAGRGARVGLAVWREGLTGDDVVAAARASVSGDPALSAG
jgi:HD-GYP domain-containing protein (c-di-GMP phosphodiesterase class II)/GGDEF domain-containing protein